MNQNNTICIICFKKCTQSDWVSYDNASGFCKCKECMSAKNYHKKPWEFDYPKLVQNFDIEEIEALFKQKENEFSSSKIEQLAFGF